MKLRRDQPGADLAVVNGVCPTQIPGQPPVEVMATERISSSHPVLDRLSGSSSLSVSERIHHMLRAAILCGRLQPDTRLVEVDLAVQFGVSRTPVREALMQLRTEGLIEADPNRGLLVRGISPQQVEAAYEVCEALDGLAARLAAQRISSPELAKLSVVLELMHDQVDWNVGEALLETHTQFHNVVLQAAHHDLLGSMRRTLTSFTRSSSFLPQANGNRSRELLNEHRAILCALRAGAGGLAERLAREHVARDRARYAEACVRSMLRPA